MVFERIDPVRKDVRGTAQEEMENLNGVRDDFLRELYEQYEGPVEELRGRIEVVLARAGAFPVQPVQEIWLSQVVLADADCDNEVGDDNYGVYVRVGEGDSEGESRWLMLSGRLPQGVLELPDFRGFDRKRVAFPQLEKKDRVGWVELRQSDDVVDDFDDIAPNEEGGGNIFAAPVYGFRKVAKAGRSDLVYIVGATPVYPLELRSDIRKGLSAKRYPQRHAEVLRDGLLSLRAHGTTGEILRELLDYGVDSVLEEVEAKYEPEEYSQ